MLDAGCWHSTEHWARGLGKETFAIRRTSAPMQAVRLPSTVTIAEVFSLTFSWSSWYLPRGPKKCLHCTAGVAVSAGPSCAHSTHSSYPVSLLPLGGDLMAG